MKIDRTLLKQGFVLAWLLLLSLLPANNLLWPTLLLLSFFLPVSAWTLLLLLPLKLCAPLFDPLLDALGYWVLTRPALQPLLNGGQHLAWLPLTRFNHSLVSGSLVVAPILWPLAVLLVLAGRTIWQKYGARFLLRPLAWAFKILPRRRLPARLRRGLGERAMRRLLKYLPRERRADFQACFDHEQLVYRLKDSLDPAQLKGLRRSYYASQYRRLHRRRSLLALGVLASLTLAWVVAKDPLLEKVISRTLGQLNGAQVDLKGFQSKFLAGFISFDRLEITDPERPDYNRFQLGSSQIDIDSAQLLHGRFVLSSLEGHELGWNQPRQHAGAVYRRPPPATPKNKAQRNWTLSLPQLDVQQLLEQERQRLESFRLLDQLKIYYQQRLEAWPSLLEQRNNDLNTLENRLRQQFETEVTVNDLQALQQRLQELRQLRIDSQALIDQIGEDVAALQQEINDLGSSWETLEQQLGQDLSLLEQRLLEQANLASLKPLLEQMIAVQLEQLYADYPQLAWLGDQVGQRLSSKSDRSNERVKEDRRRGRIVVFTGPQQPKFYADTIALSIGERQQGDFLALRVRHLSNQPELIASPIMLDWQGRARQSSYQGEAEFTAPTSQLTVRAEWLGLPVALGDDFFGGQATIRNYQGQGNFAVDLSGQKGQWTAAVRSLIRSQEITASTPLSQKLLAAILLAEPLELQFIVSNSAGQGLEISALESNIDQLAAAAWQQQSQQLLSEAQQQLRQVLEHELRQLWEDELHTPVADQFQHLQPNLINSADVLTNKMTDLAQEDQRVEGLTLGLQQRAAQMQAELEQSQAAAAAKELAKKADKAASEARQQLKKTADKLKLPF